MCYVLQNTSAKLGVKLVRSWTFIFSLFSPEKCDNRLSLSREERGNGVILLDGDEHERRLLYPSFSIPHLHRLSIIQQSPSHGTNINIKACKSKGE